MRDYNGLDDFTLQALLQKSDQNAFRLLYDRYWDKLYVMARKRLGDAQEAEEIVQDIFCNLWRRRAQIKLVKGFSNYFSVAVKYEVIDHLAKRAHATAFEKEAAAALSEFDPTTLQWLDYQELQQRFKITVDALPEKCRLVFNLQYEQGYSLKQISQELQISVKTAEAHLTKARKTLRGSLGIFTGLFL